MHGPYQPGFRCKLSDLICRALHEGDLRATKLTVDEGAVFNGHVTVGPDAVKGRPPQQPGKPGVSVQMGPGAQMQPQAQPVK